MTNVPDVEFSEEGSVLSGDEWNVGWGDLALLVPVRTHYSKAPIIEAIIELRVELPEDAEVDDLAATMQGDVRFATTEQAVQVAGEFQVREDGVVGNATHHRVGYVFRRDDGQRVVHAHQDRFIYSWLSRYENWDAFVREAEAAWANYVVVARPLRVVGVAVRFVNRLVIPSSSVEIKDYLRTSVDISPYLPQAIAQLFMQVTIPLVNREAVVTLTSALEPTSGEDTTSLILDIDAKREVRLERSQHDFSEAVTGVLSSLRDAKNFVFEACITDATRGLIR